MWQTGSGYWPVGPTLSGQVTGFPVTGTYRADITAGTLSVPGCGDITLAVTLTDAAGNTVTKQETGTGCSTTNTITLNGTYNITGGTGIYTGATGSGTSILTLTAPGVPQAPLTWNSLEFGGFDVTSTPTASAASVHSHKRKFRMHGTVSAIRMCKPAGKHHRISQRSCVRVTGKRLRMMLSG